MRIVVISTLVSCLASTLQSFYCPDQHRHLGHNILLLQDLHGGGGGGGGGGGSGVGAHSSYNVREEDKTPLPLPQPSFWSSELTARFSSNNFIFLQFC